MRKVRLAVLFSGGGTDFQSIIDGVKEGKINGEIVVSVCSNHKAHGIVRAKEAGIPCVELAKADFASFEERDRAILATLKKYDVELVVTAGYLGILSDFLLDEYKMRVVNIHPSLLPLHGGKGMYGLNVHREVIACGDKISGATVHFMDKNAIDGGEIIAQESLEVLSTDTPETLQERILNQIEHPLLVKTIGKLCDEILKN